MTGLWYGMGVVVGVGGEDGIVHAVTLMRLALCSLCRPWKKSPKLDVRACIPEYYNSSNLERLGCGISNFVVRPDLELSNLWINYRTYVLVFR